MSASSATGHAVLIVVGVVIAFVALLVALALVTVLYVGQADPQGNVTPEVSGTPAPAQT